MWCWKLVQEQVRAEPAACIVQRSCLDSARAVVDAAHGAGSSCWMGWPAAHAQHVDMSAEICPGNRCAGPEAPAGTCNAQLSSINSASAASDAVHTQHAELSAIRSRNRCALTLGPLDGPAMCSCPVSTAKQQCWTQRMAMVAAAGWDGQQCMRSMLSG
jgi:hypothetical protein